MSTIPTISKEHKFFELTCDIKNLSSPLLTHLGINHFSFKRTFNDGSKIYLFNNPNYYSHYFHEKFFLFGNKEGSIDNYTSNYELWEYLPDPRGIYIDARTNFNIANGLTITKKYNTFCDFFFFGTNKENSAINKEYFCRRDIFYNFCDYFITKGSHIITAAIDARIYLPLASMQQFRKNTLENHCIANFLKEISCSTNDVKGLTHRELSCVILLSQGKSNKEIAREFDISPRTVEDHIRNIRGKMNCNSRSKLISVISKLEKFR